LNEFDPGRIVSYFKETEGYSLILPKEIADAHDIHYETVLGLP